jgi:hypothetical protein
VLDRNFILKYVHKLRNNIQIIPFLSQRITGDFVFVTGADSSHFKSALQLLSSLEEFESESKKVFYDLGLTSGEKSILKNKFNSVEYQNFNYSLYPAYFNIKKNAGEYAWKPVIIWDELQKHKCKVVWMDAGNIVYNNLNHLKKIICSHGFYSPISAQTVERWTHKRTLKYLNAPKSILAKRNLNGACVAFDYKNTRARELAKAWCECALNRDCIAPAGSNRTNHRQDQAVLSVLAYKMNLTEKLPEFKYGFTTHNDIG